MHCLLSQELRDLFNVLSFELAIIPDIIFVGCYITPADSPYYDDAIFVYLQSLTRRDESKKVVIMGDLNSRVGTSTNLNIGKNNCAYVGVEDQTVNKNGQYLLGLCRDNGLVVVNNLGSRRV